MKIDKTKIKNIGIWLGNFILGFWGIVCVLVIIRCIIQLGIVGYNNKPITTLVNVESKDISIDSLHKLKKDMLGYKAQFGFEDNKVEMSVYSQGEKPSNTETFIEDSDGNYVKYYDNIKAKLKFSKFIWYVKKVEMEFCDKNDSIISILTFKRD